MKRTNQKSLTVYVYFRLSIFNFPLGSGPQRLTQSVNQTQYVDAPIGQTARITTEIFGFPAPNALELVRLSDNEILASSSRHSVTYTAGEAPLGLVTVAVSGVTETDISNYTVTVDNGVEDPLTYTFYLKPGWWME